MDPGSAQDQVQFQTKDHSCAKEPSMKEGGSSCSATHNGLDHDTKDDNTVDHIRADKAGGQMQHGEEAETESETDCEKLSQANGEIFSPDAEVVTVICQADRNEGMGGPDRAEKDGYDDYDTHSDSIETLEEESPQDICQEQESDSLLSQIRLTNNSVDGEDVFENQPQDESSMLQLPGNSAKPEDAQSTDSHEVLPDSTSPGPSAVLRPESLSLPRPLQFYERNRAGSEPQQHGNKRTQSVRAEALGHQRTRSEAMDIHSVKVRGDLGCGDDIMSKSLPHGTIMRKGDMIEFVADDLTEIIKRSSPMSRADSSSMGSRRSSQRSIASTSSATSTSVATSSGVSRSPSSLLTQSPDAAPPIDPGAVMELEMAARRVADNVDLMMGNLRNNLHKMSAITVGCSEAYKTSVDITCDSVDSSIKSMYALMAKCEELNKTMEPVEQIGAQIKEIKRLLDRFEAQLSDTKP